MRVPPIGNLGAFYGFGVPKGKKMETGGVNFIKPIEKDTISFTSSAKYLKKYATLPDEIKAVLTPEDAIDMFRDMEWLEEGVIKRNKIGEGETSKVYRNPWLKDYYLLILTDTNNNGTITIFSGEKLGDAIWQDKDNNSIQILRRSA